MLQFIFIAYWTVNMHPLETIVYGLLLFLLVAFGEELVIRGYVLNNLTDSMPPVTALMISSVPFALGHAPNPNASVTGVANIFFAGLVLGVYCMHRRNLWFPIGMHLAWNFCEGIVYGSPVSGVKMDSLIVIKLTGNNLLTGGQFGFEASIVAPVVMLIATYAIHRVYGKRPECPSQRLEMDDR